MSISKTAAGHSGLQGRGCGGEVNLYVTSCKDWQQLAIHPASCDALHIIITTRPNIHQQINKFQAFVLFTGTTSIIPLCGL